MDYLDGFSIFDGAVRYFDLAYLLATYDEAVRDGIPHTRLISLDQGDWGGDDLDWTATSCTVVLEPAERFIAISPAGRVQTSGGGEFVEEASISVHGTGPQQRGPLRSVRGIGHAYACGTNRQLYRRTAPGAWEDLARAATPAEDEWGQFCFESVDGFSETDIYAVGWEGEIWHYDGEQLQKIESPTDRTLHAIRCAGNGTACAAGQSGVILEGRGNDWTPISQHQTTDTFRSIEWFQDRLYLATSDQVYELEDGELRPVAWGEDIPQTCLRLSAQDDRGWSIGAKDVMELKNSHWTRVLKIP
jgi:hypothetical protein